MKTVLSATCAAALFATTTTAGGMAEPIEMAPVEIVEDTGGGTSANLVVPLILIALIAAAVGSSDGGSGGDNGLAGNASDIRLKDNIVPVGSTPTGLTLYEFSYIGSADRHVGVMAQEVLAHTPEAVVRQPSGVLFVDYDQIEADFVTLP